MGLFGNLFGKKKDREDEEPTLTIEQITDDTPKNTERRGRGGGTENPNELQEELDERQKAYDDYRQKMLSGELGDEFGAGEGQEALDELNRLDGLVKETQQKIGGRDERDLGIGAGMGALSGLGLNTAGELMSEHDVGGDGTLKQPTEFTIDTDDDEDEETILSADPKGEKGKLGKFLGNLFGRKKDDTELGMSGMTGEPLIPREETPTPTPTPTTTENNDLETTQEHHEATETTTIQDNSLDFQHLGGSRTNFDNNFVGFVLNQFLKHSVNTLTSRTTDINQKWTNLVVQPAIDTAPQFYEILNNGLNIEYKRLNIGDKHQPLTAPTLPLIIIILYLYVIDRIDDFKIDIKFLEGYFIKKVLKDYFKFNNELVDYGMDIISKIPNELATAYRKQKGTLEEMITMNEVDEITKLTQYIIIEYSKRFKKNLANELFNFENKQSLYLYEMLDTLGSSSTLFQISSAFSTINNLIVEMVSNPYLLVQLIALIYDENEGKNLASSDVLSRGKVDKYIYYYSDLEGGVKEDLKVSVLKNIHLDMDKRGKVKGMSVIENSDKVALYNYKGRYYVSFRGTDVKDEKDIRSNFLNFGGKDLLNNPDYDERIKIGKKYLDLAIMKSRQENLEPPIVLGFSLGGVSAMYLSTLYPNIETDVYSPILSKSEMTEKIMEYLGNSNIHFNYGEKDPISSNLEYYRKKYPNLDINKYRNNKFYSPHDLGQFQ